MHYHHFNHLKRLGNYTVFGSQSVCGKQETQLQTLQLAPTAGSCQESRGELLAGSAAVLKSPSVLCSGKMYSHFCSKSPKDNEVLEYMITMVENKSYYLLSIHFLSSITDTQSHDVSQQTYEGNTVHTSQMQQLELRKS